MFGIFKKFRVRTGQPLEEIGDSAFEHYYHRYLQKDTLTAEEFASLVKDWLLGMGWYIVDSVSGQQAYRIILQEIMSQFPKKWSDNERDKEWILSCSCAALPTTEKETKKNGRNPTA